MHGQNACHLEGTQGFARPCPPLSGPPQPFVGSDHLISVAGATDPSSDDVTRHEVVAYGQRPFHVPSGDPACRFSSGSSRRIPPRPGSAYISVSNAACPSPSTRTGARSAAVRWRWSGGRPNGNNGGDSRKGGTAMRRDRETGGNCDEGGNRDKGGNCGNGGRRCAP